MAEGGLGADEKHIASSITGYQHRFGIVLVGKVGCGKSASGNTIMGQEHFASSFGFSAVTKYCTGCFGHTCGRRIHVVDTPGLDDPEIDQDKLLREIDFWAAVVHVFLLVVQLGRFTPEQQKILEEMGDVFGERARDITLILFTHGDNLKSTIKEFIDKAGPSLQKMVKAYGNRYHVFNNESDDHSQVTKLFMKIDKMRRLNKGRFYTIDARLRLKIVLVGRSGCGKSTSGNTILGEKKFTSRSFCAVSKRCDWFHGHSCGRNLHVVDTPGLDEPELRTDIFLRDIDWCAPAIHVFLLVVQIGTATEELQAIAEKMEAIFGERCKDLTIILFTHQDQLTCSVETFVEKADAPMTQFLKRYGDRYHMFNNTVNSHSQVKELIVKIDKMRDSVGDRVYILEETDVEE